MEKLTDVIPVDYVSLTFFDLFSLPIIWDTEHCSYTDADAFFTPCGKKMIG